MEFFGGLLQNVMAAILTSAVLSIPGAISRMFKDATKDMKSGELQVLLQTLGAASPDAIRALVQRVYGGQAKITASQREDVAAVLISLARGANMLNTQGDPRSVYLRAEDLLKQLLESVQQLKRRAGEPVFPGYAWTLQRFLGSGGFGEVWLASNKHGTGLAKRAYKFFTHEDAAKWLEREKDRLLEVKSKLKDHPQIVKLLDVGLPDQGYPYLELEYVEGGSLEDWILDAERAKRPIRKTEVMRGIVRAAAAAHSRQIYHCDLKPANILLTAPPDVQPKITDFGLSDISVQGEETVSAAAEPLAAGTPMYWPPEAYRPFEVRAPGLYDVFALGVVWYQLLVERIERPAYDFAAELRAVGADSHTIQLISRSLAHPARRFKDACELDAHMDGADLPVWDPAPDGLFDVSHLVREFVSLSAK